MDEFLVNHILDACSLINLINGGILDEVLEHAGVTFFVSPSVISECRGTDLVGKTVGQAIASGQLQEVDDSMVPATLYLDFLEKHKLGNGETECLAVASIQGLALCSDDLKARKMAGQEIGSDRVTGSLGLVKGVVRRGQLSEESAMHAYGQMKISGAFLPNIPGHYFAD